VLIVWWNLREMIWWSLGVSTNNFSEYNAILEFLRDALSHGISHLWVYLVAQMVVSQLNGVYRVYDPMLH
jgi:ribonuclease HI